MAALNRALAFEEVHDVAVRRRRRPGSRRAADVRSAARRRACRRRTRRSPRAAPRRSASTASAVAGTTRMPLPPPPADALTSTGIAEAASGRRARRRRIDRAGVTPGTIGTPAASIRARAPIFDPMRSMTSAGGPTKTMPAGVARARQLRAFGEEAVAGMHGVRARRARGLDEGRRRRDNSLPAPPVRCGPPDRRRGRAARARRRRSRPRRSRCPASRQARAIRTAISPRLAMRTRPIAIQITGPTSASASRGTRACLPGRPPTRAARRCGWSSRR